MGHSSAKSASVAKGPTARVPARKVPGVTEEPQPTRGKRIVLCFDGTANQIGAGNLTNVAKVRSRRSCT
jgi:uncharacterized protein (DUF2235 family)